MAYQFEDTLHYSSPANGSRGIVRTGMLVPESVELFVCPFACGRHGSISAVKQNLKHRLSYLYVTQADIINGYDNLIVPAVGELLESLPETPKVILIFVSCLDDLIGTDHEALQETLAKTYPHVKFRSCHMNPISKGGKTPPAISVQNNIYSLIEKSEEKDQGINCIGNLVEIAKESEIHTYLKSKGCSELRHITQYETFEGYQDMAKSRWNLVIAPAGRQAAELMKEKHDMPYSHIPVVYGLEEIEKSYKKMDEMFEGKEEFDFSSYRSKAEAAIERALEAVGDKPIIVDASAVFHPFELAKALLTYGFNVVRVQAQECSSTDRAHYEWVCKEHPEVEIVQPMHHKAVLQENKISDSIAIGVDGAYLAGSDYVVDLFNDETMFGYHGLECLMNKLEHALDSKVDLESMIHEYGLVV